MSVLGRRILPALAPIGSNNPSVILLLRQPFHSRHHSLVVNPLQVQVNNPRRATMGMASFAQIRPNGRGKVLRQVGYFPIYLD